MEVCILAQHEVKSICRYLFSSRLWPLTTTCVTWLSCTESPYLPHIQSFSRCYIKIMLKIMFFKSCLAIFGLHFFTLACAGNVWSTSMVFQVKDAFLRLSEDYIQFPKHGRARIVAKGFADVRGPNSFPPILCSLIGMNMCRQTSSFLCKKLFISA